MDMVVVGSIALDDVKTPGGEIHQALGGSAVYAALAASYSAFTGIVGVVGQDFPPAHIQLLKDHGIDLAGLEQAAGSTFHWSGYYDESMNTAHTRATHLNVFAQFSPKLPASYSQARFLFLANIDPELQAQVLKDLVAPEFVLLDTMNFWIENKKAALLEVMHQVHMVVINDAEARQLTNQTNLIQAATWIRQHGPRGVIVKKGEHGALLFWEKEMAILPAFPLAGLKDPTGAGDTFAGGFMGALSQCQQINLPALRQAAAIGTVMASFTVENYSVTGLANLTANKIRQRYAQLCTLTRLEELPPHLFKGQ